MTLEQPEGFETFLKTLKERIASAQTRAALAVSRELLELYWTIGRDLETAITSKVWGTKVIEQVARGEFSYSGPARGGAYTTREFQLGEAFTRVTLFRLQSGVFTLQDSRARLEF